MPDFNEAQPQRSFDLIPAGTIATLQLKIRSGQAGEDGWLRRSKDGASEGLDCEFTVVDGRFAKRKLWMLFTLAGTTEGHAQAAEISRAALRAILESARGIRPDDDSDAAKQARRLSSYGDLDGLRFVARIGVVPAQNGYKAKNSLDEVITPDRADWQRVEQAAAKSASAAKPAAPATTPAKVARPQWAS
jgi:hypothetical protein